jgi:monoamine oxidase
VFDTPDGEQSVEVDHVVFALPFTRLRQCNLDDLQLTDDKRTIIDEIGYGTNAKVMAGFARPVWREDHDASGSLTCDLPVQQTWDTSIGQSGASAILTNFLGGDQGAVSGQGTPDEWVRTVVLPSVEQVFPGTTEAYTGTAQRMHWPTHPHTLGSYSCYRPGQWAFWSLEGEREGNVHFCGEHTSADFQGWMEGGAESGARVAEEITGDYDLDGDAAGRRLARLRSALPTLDRRSPLASLRARRAVFRQFVADLRAGR